jgi:hypothetical protein
MVLHIAYNEVYLHRIIVQRKSTARRLRYTPKTHTLPLKSFLIDNLHK